MLLVVALHVLPPAIFAIVHGAMRYRLRGSLIFVGLSLLVGNVFENIGVHTGFPYGRYYFTSLMGPKLFVVPIFLGLAYVGMAYLSWTLARLVRGNAESALVGTQIFTTPLLAASVMTSWDLAMDPIWGTVLHAWIWVDGGRYFGVPISNFFGWLLAVFVFYQLFAIYARKSGTNATQLNAGYWQLSVIFYALSAAGNLLLLVPRRPVFVTDPAGVQWSVHAITGVCALVSIFIMGGFALLAWLRMSHARALTTEPAIATALHSEAVQ